MWVRKSFWKFMVWCLTTRWFWLLLAATFNMTVMWQWRGWLRNRIYWSLK